MGDIRKAERIQQLVSNEGLISDISETGICLRPSGPITVSSGAVLKLELSSREQTLVLDARVVYAKPAGKEHHLAGFEFLNMTDAKRQSMFDMVDSYSRGVAIQARIVK